MSLFSIGLFSLYLIPFCYNNLLSRWHSHHILSVPHTMTSLEYSQLLTVPRPLTKVLCELSHNPCCRGEDGIPQLFVWSVHSCLFTDQKIRYMWLCLFLCGRIPPLFLPLLSRCVKNNIFFACFYVFGLRFKCQWPTEGQILDECIAESPPGKMGRAMGQSSVGYLSGYHLFIFSYHSLLQSLFGTYLFPVIDSRGTAFHGLTDHTMI